MGGLDFFSFLIVKELRAASFFVHCFLLIEYLPSFFSVFILACIEKKHAVVEKGYIFMRMTLLSSF